MKHRLFVTIALAALACAALAATATAAGKKGRLFQFRGDVVSASATSVQVSVEGGNHAALRKLLGQSQNQTFTLGSSSEILVWENGVPHVGTYADLHQGDWVTVNVRDKAGSSLSDLEAKGVGTVGDRGANPQKATMPLYMYAGTVAGGQAGDHISLNVTGGNANGLKSMLGQGAAQTFTYGDSTIFLLWQGKIPTVIDASQLKSGDRITIRVRAPKHSSLSIVEGTAAVHVGDHEPANAQDNS
jgi:hypothetical protein